MSNKTVSTTRKDMEEKDELCKLHSCLGADGKERPRQSKLISIAVAKPDQVAKVAAKLSQPPFHQNVPVA